MRAIVCGDRKLTNQSLVDQVLNEYVPLVAMEEITVVIEGEQRGADTLARRWAEAQGFTVENGKLLPFPADWDKYGKAAGPIRNRQMLIEGKPDVVVAFLAKGSKGTANMIKQAKKAGIPRIIIDLP